MRKLERMRVGIGNRKRLKAQDDIRWGRPLITTGAMIVLIVAASFGVTNYINRMEEQRSFERLYEEADTLADNIEKYSANDREELEMLSAVIAGYDDLSSPELWNLLDSYTNIGMMSRIELLLPGDVVLTGRGEKVDAAGTLSFEEEAAKGVHISDRERDVVQKDTYVARHYVPVEREGKTVAMLYGVIVLGELPEESNLNPYGGKGALYIIDGNTGDFLVDTWHSGETGNMWAMGGREMAPGYDHEQLSRGVKDGESRYVVFVSKTIGEYLYFYYQPMAINDWRIAVSVPESVVFENANIIKRILNIFLAFESVCFVAYFLWMMRHLRKVADVKQKRIDTLNHIYDIERLLFNAHEQQENVCAALEKLGSILSAGKVSFRILGAGGDRGWYLWEEGKAAKARKENDDRESVGKLMEFFAAGNGEYESDDKTELKEIFPEEELSGISSAMAVPVEGEGGLICGILAAFDLERREEQAVFLRSMQFGFGMFCSNLKSHMEIREQGDRDALTGLYNRNRYERELPQIHERYRSSLACVYIDANGLHEMNNTKGHDKGDEMLRTVAEEIEKHFDTEYIYRTGGDEFVLFIPDADEKEVKARSEELVSALSKAEYHISVGIRCERNISSMSMLIKAAEQEMYAEKEKYYRKHDRRRNH